LLKQSCAKR